MAHGTVRFQHTDPPPPGLNCFTVTVLAVVAILALRWAFRYQGALRDFRNVTDSGHPSRPMAPVD
jgi:hypothetical protein